MKNHVRGPCRLTLDAGRSISEKEASEPERVKVFWENARKCFDEYDAKA
jgi:hypothetical protein